MTLKQMNAAFDVANSDEDLTKIYNEALNIFWCFALKEFKPVTCTIRHLAVLIRYQAHLFNGDWDMDALKEIRKHGKKKFEIIGN